MPGTERLLETLPGVRSASLEGDLAHATEVRLVVEEHPPASETLEAVRAALEANADECPPGAFFRIRVASVGDESPHLRSELQEEPATPSRDTPASGCIRLIAHQINDVGPGVVGVELTLGLGGRRFAGAASGKANSPGSDRLPALATLSALGAYIRFASEGGGGPTLVLDSVSEFTLGGSRVAVVVVSISGHAVPLIASWPLTEASGPAVVRATLAATARRVTRLSMGGERSPWKAMELVESGGVVDSGGILRQRAESLLESAKAIASARIVLDKVEGLRIHVLATSEMPRGEVSRMVKTLLEEGLGLQVRLGQVTVAQSRLTEEELDRVLGRGSPSASPTEGMTSGLQATGADPSAVVSRLTLVDFHIVSKKGGEQEVGVRIAGGSSWVDGQCQAVAGGEALLRPLAEATLNAVGGLTQGGGRRAALVLKDVRRFRRRGDEGVMVLVEAKVDGRKTLLSGAAFSADSFERASVVAILQATNTFVAGDLEIAQPDRPQTGSADPRDRSPQKPFSSRPSESPRPSDSSQRSDSPATSDSSKAPAPDDYVSEVLSRILSTRKLDRTPPWWARSASPRWRSSRLLVMR